MKFIINGKFFQTKDTFTILELIIYLNLISFPIAIELNEIFVIKESWKNIKLQDRDNVEIVTIVGGG